MNRMTHERCNGIKSGYWSPYKKEILVSELAKYENIGLVPEEITEMKAFRDCKKPIVFSDKIIYFDTSGDAKFSKKEYFAKCPTCETVLCSEEYDIKPSYCESCGQHIDWEGIFANEQMD